MFVREMLAGWGDMDFNGHMRNTSFLDKGADIRMMFFAEHGFPAEPIGSQTTRRELLEALRGARVEVRGPAGAITGRLLSVERRTRAQCSVPPAR